MFAHTRRLRWSGEEHGYQIDIEAVARPETESGVPGGGALLRLVDSFFEDSAAEQEEARHQAEAQLGQPGFVDAGAVFANFEMMNRVAEGTGIPVPPQALQREAEMLKILGL